MVASWLAVTSPSVRAPALRWRTSTLVRAPATPPIRVVLPMMLPAASITTGPPLPCTVTGLTKLMSPDLLYSSAPPPAAWVIAAWPARPSSMLPARMMTSLPAGVAVVPVSVALPSRAVRVMPLFVDFRLPVTTMSLAEVRAMLPRILASTMAMPFSGSADVPVAVRFSTSAVTVLLAVMRLAVKVKFLPLAVSRSIRSPWMATLPPV